MQNYLDLRNDFIFKLFFSTPENHPLLISFLESVIKPLHPISEVIIFNSNLLKDVLSEKASMLDVLVKLKPGVR